MWPAVKQMKEESYNDGYDSGYGSGYNSGYDSGLNMGELKFAEKMVNAHMLTIEQAAMSLNLTIEEYLAAVKNLKK